MGLGTPRVESLTSYIMRLAAAHSVTPGTLFRHALVPLYHHAYLLTPEKAPRAGALLLVKAVHAFNGSSSGAAGWVAALTALTHCDQLRQLTMLNWREVLTLRSLTRTRRAWCPDCYTQQRAQEEPVYEALSWTLNCVTVCPQHCQPLQSLCPHCGKWSPPLANQARAGYCCHCQAWLGSVLARPDKVAVGTSTTLGPATQEATLVGEALAWSAQLPALLAQHNFAALLAAHIRHCTKGNVAAFARFVEVDYLKLKQLKTGVNLPSLAVVIHLLQRLGLSVADFFRGGQATVPLPEPRDICLRAKKAAAVSLLQAALRDESRPALRSLAQQLGYRQENQLRHISPPLCKEITARHQAVRVAPTFLPRRHTDEALQAALSEALAENPAPAVQMVAARLGYKYASTLKQRSPTLYQELRQRRRAYLQEQARQTQRTLQKVLHEDPPPPLRVVRQRLGYTNDSALKYQHPALCQALIKRHRDYAQGRTQQIKLALGVALGEEPPPSVRELARRVDQSISHLYRQAPDTCRQLAARRLEYLANRAAQKQAEFRSEVRRVVAELHAGGVYPSPSRVQRGLPASVVHLMRREDALTVLGEALQERGIW
jgi:hypothetical protein